MSKRKWNLPAATQMKGSALLCALVVLLASCGGGSALVAPAPPPPAQAASNPSPSANSLNPTKATVGATALQLRIDGSGFVAGSTVTWNGASLNTTFVTQSQLLATVAPTALAIAGTAQVQVTNPLPGGGTSSALSFTIENAVPAVTAVAPANADVGSAGLDLTVDGSNFAPGAEVQWNGASLSATTSQAAQIIVHIPASFLVSAGTAQITVWNPGPGGGASTAIGFAINNPVPSVVSVSPNATPAGGSGLFTVVGGSGFVAGSIVEWDGQPLTTMFVSTSQLQVAIPAAEISTVGSAQIQVRNPAPGGGVSNLVGFTIQNGLPTITAISPGNVSAAGKPFTLRVDGNQFVAGATIYWNGLALNTALIAGSLEAQVSADKIVAAGLATISVSNPAPGGGNSAPITLSVDSVVPRLVYVAQPQEGLISRMFVDASTGELRYAGYDKVMAAGDGPWHVHVDRTHQFLYAPDLANNLLYAYRIDAKDGSLTPVPSSPVQTGLGPSSLASDPSGRFVYVVNFDSNNISGFSIDPSTGALIDIPGSPFATGANPAVAEIELAGRYLYVSGYTSNDISVYTIDSSTGALTPIVGSPFANPGDGAWGITLDPQGRFLYVTNENSGDISGFQVNSASGSLTAISPVPVQAGVYPQQVTIDSTGRFAYVPDYKNGSNGEIYVMAIDAVSGQLTNTPGSPYPAGNGPLAVSLDNSSMHAYVPNYNSWDVTMYQVDPMTGALTASGSRPSRRNPWYMAMIEDATPVSVMSKFALSASTANALSSFAVDATTGDLVSVAVVPTGIGPSSIAIEAKNGLAIITNSGSGAVSTYSIASNGTLTGVSGGSVSVGTPQAVAVESSHRFAFVAGGSSGIVTALNIYPPGALSVLGTFAAGTNPSSVATDPTGRYLYVGDSGTNSIRGFSINPATGLLTQVQNASAQGISPKAIAVDPLSRYMCAVNSANVVCFSLQASTGIFSNQRILYNGPAPQAIAVAPSGRFVYLTDMNANVVMAYEYIPASGSFSLIGTFGTGAGPGAVTVDACGQYLYVWNASSSDVTIFSVGSNGALTIHNTTPLANNPRASTMMGIVQ